MFKELALLRPVDIAPFQEEREKRGMVSPIVVMSDVMRTEAIEILKDVSRNFEQSAQVQHRPTWDEVYRNLSVIDRNKFLLGQAAAGFAALLPEIEMALVYRSFNTKGFYDRYNATVAKTVLPAWSEPETHEEVLSDDTYNALMHRVKNDQSFANLFYGEGVNVLPQTARERLEAQGLLKTINDIVAPSYYSVFRQVFS